MTEADILEFRNELTDRRRRLEGAVAGTGGLPQLTRLLQEVDEALQRIEVGLFGRCDTCHDDIEKDRLRIDPLIRTCLDHLTPEEQRALEQDLALATRVQGTMLPQRNLRAAGWEVSFHYEPAGAVSGDYCDLISGNDPAGDLFFLLGDVAGKGVAASMLMACLRAIVRTLADANLPLQTLVERANRLFCESVLPSHYATLVLGRAAPSGELEICNAGHCPPLLVRPGAIETIEATGLPLGLFCSSPYEVRRARFSRGDLLVLCTDGLLEARHGSGAEYGMGRLKEVAAACYGKSSRALVESCLQDLRAFRAGAPPSDDLSIMALGRAESAAR